MLYKSIIVKTINGIGASLVAFNLAAYPIGYETGKSAQIRMTKETMPAWVKEFNKLEDEFSLAKYFITRIGIFGYMHGVKKNLPHQPRWV